jgi:hypothetical protein
MSDKKVKRRIVPTQILNDEPVSTKGSLQQNQWSTTTQDHFKALHRKDAVKKIRERAVALGYEKERKERGGRKGMDDGDHGGHHEHLSDFSEYVLYFVGMRPHSRGVSLLDYLRKNFEKGMYFSSRTKRFRKLR